MRWWIKGACIKIVAIGLLVSFSAHAGFSVKPSKDSFVESPACALDVSLLGGAPGQTLPRILARSEKVPLEHKVLDIPRLLHATNVIELNGKVDPRLQHLPNGNYVYTIDTDKRLVLMPRTLNSGLVDLNSPEATFLGSHEGITHFLRAIYRTEPRYLAAGEITIRDGRVMMVSNGAGS